MPWSWNTDLAVSRPIMVMLIAGGSLCRSRQPAPWHMDAVGGRPPNLGKTLAVPLLQEQAMRIAVVAAKFTPDEADDLRRAMATFKYTQGVAGYRARLGGGAGG